MKLFRNPANRSLRVAKMMLSLSAAAISGTLAQAQGTSPLTPHPAPESSAATLVGDQVEYGISLPGRQFIEQAAQANKTEIAMANAAELRSGNTAIKELARMMRKDHQENFATLSELSQSHLMAVDASLSAQSQRAVNKLQKASDAEFDKDYAKTMLKDHVKAIKLFDRASVEIPEPYLKQYAQNTLPGLRKHLRHAEDTARAVGVDAGSISSILKGLPSQEAQRAVTYNSN